MRLRSQEDKEKKQEGGNKIHLNIPVNDNIEINMRLRSQEDKEKKQEGGNKIHLNIPVNDNIEITKDEIYKESSPLVIERLEDIFQKVHLDDDDDSYSSENDEKTRKELEKYLTAKSPDKIKDKNRLEIRNNTQPYITTRTEISQSRGDVTIQPSDNRNFSTNKVQIPHHLVLSPYNYNLAANNFQIPQPVIDYVSGNQQLVENSVEPIDQIYAGLSDEDRNTLDYYLYVASLGTEGTQHNTTGNQIQCSRDSDFCNSPDSSYSSMSPASAPPPSPYYSLHSPNPPTDKMRVSESDSMSSVSNDFELGSSELPFGPVEIGQLQTPPFIHISPQPRQQVHLNCNMQPRLQPSLASFQLLRSARVPKIQPDSEIIVNEFGLDSPALKRLQKQNIMKENAVTIQWVKAVKEANPLEALKKREETKKLTTLEIEELKKTKNKYRKNLIDLIKEGPKQQPYFYERLYSRIKLYNRIYDDILTGKDENGHTPLYAAAIFQQENPLIARLIVDVMEDKVGKLDDEDNTIFHYLAKAGDSHAQVLSELLYSKFFDVNHKNIRCKTALHVAVETHNTKSCLACVKQFVKHGADLKLKDFDGKTALHLAVTIKSGEPLLLKALLQSPTATNAINLLDNVDNSPLHLAAYRNDLPLPIHKELVDQLVHSGARHDIRNNQQRTALMMVDLERKVEIRNILQRK